MTRPRPALAAAAMGLVALTVLYLWVALAQPEVTSLDARVFELAGGSDLPGNTSVLWALSTGTNTVPLLVATVIVGVGGLAAGVRRSVAVFWAVSLFSSLTVTVLKDVTDRSRPPPGQLLESTPAWPSGHSAGSLVFALGVALVIWEAHDHRIRLVVLVLIPAALAVGYSRAYLGLHWATDVIAGWLVAGIAAALLAAFGSPPTSDPPPRMNPSRARLGWLHAGWVVAALYLVGVGVTAPPWQGGGV